MEKTGFDQEETRGEEGLPRSQNAEDNLSGLHLSDSEPSTQAMKNRKRNKGKKSRRTNDPGDNTAIPAPASTLNHSPAASQQEPPTPAATPKINPKQSANVFSDESRLATCRSTIEATRRKIVNIRRGQFDDIYTEFKQLCEISWGVTKGEMSRLLIGYRDPSRVVTLHKCISKFPSEIPANGLPKTIEILTKSVQEVLLIFLDVVAVFHSYRDRHSSGLLRTQMKNPKAMNFYAAKEAEWKRFDVQVAGLESTICRFEKEMELIRQGKKWNNSSSNKDALKEMLEMEKEMTEKVIKEMMKKEREVCDAIGCPCVEKERLGNLLVPGLGTKARDDADRNKIVEILNGKEPWKEDDKEKVFEDFKKRRFGSDGRSRTRES